MITLEDWALIRRLHLSEGVPKAQIARDLKISRNTVAKAVASVDPPEYSRAPVVTSFEPFEKQVRLLLEDDAVDAGDGAGRAGRLVGVGDVVSSERRGDPAGLCTDRSG